METSCGHIAVFIYKSLRRTYLSFEVLSCSWHLEDTCDHPISWTKLRQLSVVGTQKDLKKEYQIFFCKDINYFFDLSL